METLLTHSTEGPSTGLSSVSNRDEPSASPIIRYSVFEIAEECM